jgi:hypothetical protein
MAEQVLVRGTESAINEFRAELEAFVAEHQADPAVLVPEASPVRPRMGERLPLGHQAWLEIAMEVGKVVAMGVISSVLKDLIIDWIKTRAKEKGLWVQTRDG